MNQSEIYQQCYGRIERFPIPRVVTRDYYASGPRVEPWRPLDRYWAWGSEIRPKPGELEYLYGYSNGPFGGRS